MVHSEEQIAIKKQSFDNDAYEMYENTEGDGDVQEDADAGKMYENTQEDEDIQEDNVENDIYSYATVERKLKHV